jgi:hypothetical protein
MRRINSMVWGTVLLLAGLVLTLGQLRIIDLSGDMTVPILLLAVSVVFHLYYFLSSGRNEGLLVPGGIMLVYGLLFLSVAKFNCSMNQMWPLFILGPALGLFELYVFSKGTKGSMVPVFILTVIGGGFLLMNFYNMSFAIIIAIVLIVLGVTLMVNAFFKSSHKGEYKPIEVKIDTEPKPEQKAEEIPKQ